MIETRTFAEDLQLREEGDGRTLFGTIVPYGVETRIGYYTETFHRGAYADVASMTLTATHPRTGGDLPIGISTLLREEDSRWYGEFRVSVTPDGDAVLNLARDGVPLAFSVGFQPVPGGDRWTHNRSHVDRFRVAGDHVAVVRRGAYPGTAVALRGYPVGQPLLRLAMRR